MTGQLENATVAVDALSVWYKLFVRPFSLFNLCLIYTLLFFLIIILTCLGWIWFLQYDYQRVGNDDSPGFLRWSRVLF